MVETAIALKEPAEVPPPADRRETFERLIGLAVFAGRLDLAAELREEWGRAERVSTTVVLAGPHGAGKTSLLGSLLSQPDLGADGGEGGRLVVRGPGDPEMHADLPGAPATDVVLDHPLLASGLVLVDAPGARGVVGGDAEIALATLRRAECLLFVAGADAPIGPEEIAFLRRAAALVGTVVVALTKVDAHESWRDVLELDRETLVSAGLDGIEIRPVAGLTAGERRDDGGLPVLRRTLAEFARGNVERSRHARLASAASRALRAIGEADAVAVGDAADLSRLREARRRTEYFQRANRVAGLVLVDELACIQEDVEFALNRSLSAVRRTYEAILGALVYRSKAETEAQLHAVECELNRELVAVAANAVCDLVEAFEQLRRCLVDELGVDLASVTRMPAYSVSSTIASEVAPAPTSVPAPMRLVEVGGYGSTFYWWAVTGPIGGVIGAILGTFLSIGRWRQSGRTHAHSLGRLLLTNAIEEARTEFVPLLRRQFRSIRREFEETLTESVAQRDRRLAALLETAPGDKQSLDVRRAREIALQRRPELGALKAAVERI